MRRILPLVGCAAIVVGAGWVLHQQAAGDSEKAEPLVYELRTYVTEPGRLPALHKRFREHTLRLFEKHGMKNIAYWTPEGKDDTLVYVVAHKSRQAADKSWQAFRDDPEWQKVYEESHKDGKIVAKVERQFLVATDYSPMK